MATAISGFRGRVMVAGAALLASKWSVTYKTELQDCSSFEEVTGGVNGAITPISRYVASLSDMECSIDAFYDLDTGIIPAIKPGSKVQCELFTNKGVELNFAAPGGVKKFSFEMIIENLTTDTEVRGVIKYTLAGRVSGGTAITLP